MCSIQQGSLATQIRLEPVAGVELELVSSTSDDWTTVSFERTKDALSFLVSGPRYGFRNADGVQSQYWVAHRPGWMRFVPANLLVESQRPPGEWSYLRLIMPEGWGGNSINPQDPVFDLQSPELELAVRKFVQQMKGDRSDLNAGMSAIKAELARVLARQRPPRGVAIEEGLPIWRTRKVLKLIERNLTQPIANHEMAEEVGLSTAYFSAMFTRTIGAAPHAYLLSRRLQRARSALNRDGATLTDIALDSGFASSAHFSSAFRREFGVTPSAARQAAKGS